MKVAKILILIIILLFADSTSPSASYDIGAVPATGSVDVGAVQSAPVIGAVPGQVIFVSEN